MTAAPAAPAPTLGPGRAIPPAWRAEWAAELAARHAPAPDASTRSRWLQFRIGCELFALPATAVLRSHLPGPAHGLPGRRVSLLPALMQLEGRLLLVADLARCLGAQRTSAKGFARVLELDAPPSAYALPVDEVLGIVDIAQAQVAAVPCPLPPALHRLCLGLWQCSADADATVAMIDALQLAARLDADLG